MGPYSVCGIGTSLSNRQYYYGICMLNIIYYVQQLIGYTVTAYNFILFQGTCHLYHSEHMNDQSEPLPYCID